MFFSLSIFQFGSATQHNIKVIYFEAKRFEVLGKPNENIALTPKSKYLKYSKLLLPHQSHRALIALPAFAVFDDIKIDALRQITAVPTKVALPTGYLLTPTVKNLGG